MKNQKKWELLKYAYDNYPKGTICKWSEHGGEIRSTGTFNFNDDYIVTSEEFAVFDGKKWAEIVKPKIAVKVENEKEFKVLMKYYDSLRYVWNGGDEPLKKESLPYYPNAIKFEDKFQHSTGKESPDYQIIPFSEFAAEHGIKLPLLQTMDGVDVYENDNVIIAGRGGSKPLEYKNWPIREYIAQVGTGQLHENHYKDSDGVYYWAKFSTKQAALDWIEAQKPKEKVLEFGAYKFTIKKDRISVSHGNSDALIDITSLYKSFLELQ